MDGFPEGKGLGQVILNTTSSYLDLCEYIQSELKKIGIELKIDVNTPSSHRQMVATSKLNFFRGGWIKRITLNRKITYLYFTVKLHT